MPPGSKRKFISYQEPSGATMARQPSNRGGFVERPVPTPETQDLYNKMRQEEEKQLTQESLSQMQNRQNGFLHPPSPSQVTASSPSPSHASTTHSISQAMGGMGVDDTPQAKKQRPGRHGPLSEYRRSKTALVRELGACADCRKRRVKCNHLDLTLFEDAYQATRRLPTQSISNGHHPTPASPHRLPLGDSSDDLRGVGTGQNPTGNFYPPFQGEIQTAREEANADFGLAQNQPLRPDVESILFAFERSGPPVPNYSPRSPLAPALQFTQEPPPVAPTQSGQVVPIGKQVRPFCQGWVCLWASHEYGSWSRGEVGPCNQHFDDLETLKQHFATSHVPFYGERCIWRCIKCDLDLSTLSGPCPQCSQPFTWQEWCWARLSIPSAPPSLSLGPVPSQDGYGSPSSHSSQNPSAPFYNSSGGGHNNPMSFLFGGYGHSSGSGSGYGYHSASPTRPKQSSSTTACCGKPAVAPATCHPSGSSLVADMWHMGFYPSDKNALFRHVCPVVAVFGFLLVALANTWAFTDGRSGGGVDDVVSSIVWGIVDDVISSIVSSIFPDGQTKILDWSVSLIVVGVGVPWLFRHVKARRRQQQQQQQQYENQVYELLGDVRGVGDVSDFGQDRLGLVGIAAA